MFVDLIDALRCPVPHDDRWLVAASSRTVDRHILEGTLSCPVCGAEYAVRDGAVWFGLGHCAGPSAARVVDAGDPAEVTRLAALLGIDDHGGRYLFDGPWSAMIAAVTGVGPGQALVLEAALAGASVLRDCGTDIPLATGSLRGVVLARPLAELAVAATRVLRPAGRLVAPSETPVPAGVTLLARDDRQWVASRDATAAVGPAAAPVVLRRA